MSLPSSKWWASTAVSTATLVAVMIAASIEQGVSLPQWLVLVGSVLGPIVTYLKRENNPSPTAVEAARHRQ